jgi:hypothetical protein
VSLLNEFKLAGSALLNAGTQLATTKINADAAKAQAKANAASVAQQKQAMGSQGEIPAWVKPASLIGGGVLLLIVVVSLFRRK